MTDFKCSECGDEFEYKHHCVLHAIEWKHENFDIIETEHRMHVKKL